jgi:protein SCO1/2
MKIAALLCLALVVGIAHAADVKLKAGVFEPPRQAPDFTLNGSDGSPLKLSNYRGKVVLLGFGFTNCPAVCPTTLSTLARARRKLGAEGKDLQVVYVTVDPERDSPPKLQAFLSGFDASFIGATGSPEQLDRVRREYGVKATKVVVGFDQGDYAVDHSTSVYLIDREGSLRAMMPYSRSADDYAHDVAILLKK